VYLQSKDHRRLSFETLRREFELADCLTYIKAGMESIIEDEVTQCFEAEELKVDITIVNNKYVYSTNKHAHYRE
jgi:hypothetical protein